MDSGASPERARGCTFTQSASHPLVKHWLFPRTVCFAAHIPQAAPLLQGVYKGHISSQTPQAYNSKWGTEGYMIMGDRNSPFHSSNNVRLNVSAVCNLRWFDSGLVNMGDLGVVQALGKQPRRLGERSLGHRWGRWSRIIGRIRITNATLTIHCFHRTNDIFMILLEAKKLQYISMQRNSRVNKAEGTGKWWL